MENNKRWRDKNPDRVHIMQTEVANRRRDRKLGHPDTLTIPQWERALAYFDNKCAICGKSPDFWTVLAKEHWIPVSDPRPDNPGYSAVNIIPMCHARKDGEGGCNNAKWKHDPIKWVTTRYGKRKGARIIKRILDYFTWVREQDGE